MGRDPDSIAKNQKVSLTHLHAAVEEANESRWHGVSQVDAFEGTESLEESKSKARNRKKADIIEWVNSADKKAEPDSDMPNDKMLQIMRQKELFSRL